MKERYGKKAALIFLGNAIITIAATYFIEPSWFLCGGTTGIALFVKNVFGVRLSVTVLAVNILMLGLAWTVLGRNMALSAIASSLLYPVFLHLIEYLPAPRVPEDPWIYVFLGGGLMGLGIGTVLKAGASSGGIDIPALILNRKKGVPVSTVLYVMDLMILCAQLTYASSDKILYSILMVLVSSVMVNISSVPGRNQVQATIVSDCPEIIVGRIQTELKRGATYLKVITGYRQKDTRAVLCTLPSRELPKLKQIVETEDPQAFMTLLSAMEVRGRGFTLKKE